MRTINADYDALLKAKGGTFKRFRVRVRDALGTLRDLTTYPGIDFVVSASWSENVDSQGHDCTIIIRRNYELLNLSPFMEGSALNRRFESPGTYAPLIDLGREVFVDWSISATETPTYVVGFHGYIDSFNPANSDGTMRLTARGQYALALDTFIERERAYAFATPSDIDATKGLRIYANGDVFAAGELVIPSEAKLNGRFYAISSITTGIAGTEGTWPIGGSATFGGVTVTDVGPTTTSVGTNVETVIQQILNDNMTSAPTLTTTVSPAWLIRYYKQSRTGVWLAIRALVDQIGWDLRYKFNAGLGDYRLELNDVPRSATIPNREFRADERFRLSRLETKLEGIRNVVRVIFRDSQDLDPSLIPRRKVVEVVDSTSVSKYGRRFMEVGEGKTTNIDTTSEATTFANIMLADLKDPVAELEVEMPFFPFVELGDLYRFKADGVHSDVDQDLAVVSYSHSMTSGERPKATTTITCRGKPSGGYRRWLAFESGRNVGSQSLSKLIGFNHSVNVDVRTPGGVSVLPRDFFSKSAYAAAMEFHVSKTAGFIPSPTTLKQSGYNLEFNAGNLDPGDVHYVQTIPWHYENGIIVRGQPSFEVSFTPGYIEPRHLNPERFRGELPPNGSFEGFTRSEGVNVPPDQWEMVTGTWNTDITIGPAKGGADARDGSSYIRFLATSVAASIRSKWFPVSGGDPYELSGWLFRNTGTQSIELIVEYATATKSVISSSGLTVTLSDYTELVWTQLRTRENAPSTAAFARVYVRKVTADTHSFWFDAVKFERVGEPWHYIGDTDEPPFENSWDNFDAVNEQRAAFRVANGFVELRGIVASGSTGSVPMFTLPVYARPQYAVRFSGVSNAKFYLLEVRDSGEVWCVNGDNAWASLEGCRFALFQ
jgi:hypothetical protein